MPAKPNKPAARARASKSKRVDRPFDRELLRRAREITAGYRILLEAEPDLGYVGRPVELPLVFADGKTADECVANVREAAVGVVAYMLEGGEIPPAPASENRRDQQVNIRLTVEEKLRLEDAARQQGFRGISDYVRSRSLAGL